MEQESEDKQKGPKFKMTDNPFHNMCCPVVGGEVQTVAYTPQQAPDKKNGNITG